MTPEELAELDRKVAEAAGIPVLLEDWYLELDDDALDDPVYYPHVCVYRDGHCNLWEAPQEDGTLWRPSMDWNDAMYAAEKAELFEDGMLYLAKSPGGWAVEAVDRYGYAGNIIVSNGETGPLAICNAILAMKDVAVIRKPKEKA